MSIDPIEKILNEFTGYNDKEVFKLKEAFETKMMKILVELTELQECRLEDFLALMTGLAFWPSLMENLRQKQRSFKKNVTKTVKSLLSTYTKQFKKLNNCKDKEEISKSLQLLRWVELIEKYNIHLNIKIKQKFLLSYFAVDWKISENGLERGITLNELQATRYLSKELGWEITSKNLLELCTGQSDYNFGAYIDYNKYCEFQTEHLAITSGIEIQQAIDTGIIEKNYRYNYNGLIRLVSVNKQDAFSDFLSKQTVAHLRDGGDIIISPNNRILSIQRSLSDLILGKSQLIAVRKQDHLLTIMSKDLIYRQEELQIFANKYKNQHPHLCNTQNEQLFSRAAIKKTYDKLSEDQWKHFFKNEDDNGLIKAKIPANAPRSERYKISGIESWLLENGHYTPKELRSLTGNITYRDNKNDFSDIINLIQK